MKTENILIDIERTDAEKLLLLARWFDMYNKRVGYEDTDVQDDLRRIAAKIETMGDDWHDN